MVSNTWIFAIIALMLGFCVVVAYCISSLSISLAIPVMCVAIVAFFYLAFKIEKKIFDEL